ncbi:MAG: hypothetical protein HC927_12220 [Deltaproteobacteria bacterium]|nr:hypothetical protein [Deltaproteobacteria bacterium]
MPGRVSPSRFRADLLACPRPSGVPSPRPWPSSPSRRSGPPASRSATSGPFPSGETPSYPASSSSSSAAPRSTEGWGPGYLERLHQRGKLSARERVARLIDPGSEVFEVGTFVNYGDKFGDRGLESPGAGVITAFCRIAGRWCMVIANDNTVASGSWWPRTPEKIQRAQTMALRLRLPTIYLVDCSGLFLPEQSRSFPGGTGPATSSR